MNIWFAVAALIAVVTLGLHVFLGGREAAEPLLKAADLDQLAKFTNYYCWHLVSIAIGGVAVAFGYSAYRPDGVDVAIFASCICALFALWSAGMIVVFRLRPMQFAQWALFLPISLLGLIGSLSS